MNSSGRLLYTDQILASLDAITQYMEGASKDHFLNSTEKQDAVCMRLMVIGEAAYHLRHDYGFDEKYPEIPWHNIIALRHILAHDYQIIDMERIWGVVQKRLPELKAFLLSL